MGRAVAALGMLVGTAALLLQFSLTIPASMQAGRGLFGSLLFFFTFFTILTNILIVLVYAGRLSGRRAGALAWLGSPRVAAGAAVAIAVVGIVYAVVLARLWQPQGLFRLADMTLHYVTPLLYLCWWLLLGRDGSAGWRDIPRWLAYPLAYLAVAMARGAMTGEYPYPFLDPAPGGAGAVAVASLGVFALFAVLSALLVLADRNLPPPRR